MRALVFACLGTAMLLVGACGPSTGADCAVCGDNSCVDLSSDPLNCGACGVVCGSGRVCDDNACVNDGQAQCDEPGAVEECYTGAVGTEGVGTCHGGQRTCGDNGYWSPCSGQVLPASEACSSGADEDCDSRVDEDADADGDGFTNCGGDCCDSTAEGCADPERVNPGAIEVDGNMLDDDCDGTADNATEQPLCDTGLMSNSPNAMDFAKAMDLCAETTPTDPHWGVISARFVKADGSGAPNANQKAIRPEFGATAVQHGSSMVVVSTANASATSQTNPPAAPWQSTDHGANSGFPADWFTANGNQLPNAPGCPPASTLFAQANDPVMLELKVKTPSNAASFSMRVNFMSAEYPEWTCTAYNDFFVVLLDSGWSGSPANPTDKNLAFYTSPSNQNYPVGVNLAYGNTGLFQVCRNGEVSCRGINPDEITTCTSNAELVGTGMETVDNSCETGSQVGGGTGWLTTSGNVKGGEIITLRIALWDTSDGAYDSVALIDDFRWSLDPSDPGTVIDVD